MVDKNGVSVKIGDYVLFDPRFDGVYHICMVSNICKHIHGSEPYEDVELPWKLGNGVLWRRSSAEIEKLSDEEAMLWMLE